MSELQEIIEEKNVEPDTFVTAHRLGIATRMPEIPISERMDYVWFDIFHTSDEKIEWDLEEGDRKGEPEPYEIWGSFRLSSKSLDLFFRLPMNAYVYWQEQIATEYGTFQRLGVTEIKSLSISRGWRRKNQYNFDIQLIGIGDIEKRFGLKESD